MGHVGHERVGVRDTQHRGHVVLVFEAEDLA